MHEAVERTLAIENAINTPLNGFPLVNHGVEIVREVVEQFADVPLQVRHSTRDPRLLAEISLAAGVTGFEGGPLSYNLPYYRDYPVAESLSAWRYVDTLCGEYSKDGLVVDREFFGVLTATLVPPCLAIVVCVLESLLAAECGVLSVSLGYAEQGNRVQDIAAMRAMRATARRYLDAFGHTGVLVHTVFHQYMGAFPSNHDDSKALLRGSAVTAARTGATRLMLKSYAEATSIPTAVHNSESLALVREALRGRCPDDDAERVAEETQHVVDEASGMLDAILGQCPGGTTADAIRAVERGLIDIPFSPSEWNAGKVITVRDREGAVRFADPGAVPLPAAALRRETALVDRRVRADCVPLDVLVQRDVQVASSRFRCWPLLSP